MDAVKTTVLVFPEGLDAVEWTDEEERLVVVEETENDTAEDG